MKMSEVEFENEIKVSSLVKLFEFGKVSSGIAARALKISRVEFLELLRKYKVNFINCDNFDLDYENA